MLAFSWIVLIIFILFFWKFVYYRYHETILSTAVLVFLATFLGAVGIVYTAAGRLAVGTLVSNIAVIYIPLAILASSSYAIIFSGYKKNKNHMNKHIDITITLFKKLGFWKEIPVALLLSLPLFLLIVIGSYAVLGAGNIYVWILVMAGWIASDVRVVHYIEKIRN